MEVIIIIGVAIAAIAGLCLLAAILRVSLVWFAKRRGYTADNMPMLYHMFAFGIYFSILIVAHLVYLTVIR